MGRVAALLTRHLIHRCTVTPAASTLTDEDGQPVAGWGSPVAGVACRLTDLDDAELLDRRQAGATRYTDALLVLAATDLPRLSRVSDIQALDRNSGVWTTIEPGPYAVADVKTRYADAAAYKRALLDRTG